MSPTVPTPLSYELLHDRAESLRRHGAKIRVRPDGSEALRVFVRQCLDLPGNSRDLVAEARRLTLDMLSSATPGTTVDATPLMMLRRATEELLAVHADLLDLGAEMAAGSPRTNLPGPADRDPPSALRQMSAEIRQMAESLLRISQSEPIRSSRLRPGEPKRKGT